MRSDLKTNRSYRRALDDARIVPACSTVCDPGDERRCRKQYCKQARCNKRDPGAHL